MIKKYIEWPLDSCTRADQQLKAHTTEKFKERAPWASEPFHSSDQGYDIYLING